MPGAGQALRTGRERQGITQRDLGRQIGYSDAWVSAVENGRRRLPQAVMAHVADALDDPEVYLAVAREVTNGVMVAPVLDGPRACLDPLACMVKSMEENEEAAVAGRTVLPLMAVAPEALTPEEREMIKAALIEEAESATGSIVNLSVQCRAYGFSPAEIWMTHLEELAIKGYIRGRPRATKNPALASRATTRS